MFSVALAVHGPRLNDDARVPDVIRHTALRSSDFPLPATPVRRGEQVLPAATARSSCQGIVYRETRRQISNPGVADRHAARPPEMRRPTSMA